MSDPMIIMLEGTFQHGGMGRFDPALDAMGRLLGTPRQSSVLAMAGAHIGFAADEFLRASLVQVDESLRSWRTSLDLNPFNGTSSDRDGHQTRAVAVVKEAASKLGPGQACVVITTECYIQAYLESIGHQIEDLLPGAMIVIRGGQVERVIHPDGPEE